MDTKESSLSVFEVLSEMASFVRIYLILAVSVERRSNDDYIHSLNDGHSQLKLFTFRGCLKKHSSS